MTTIQSSPFGAASSASAPGKIILFGEHAVVHGRPALAVPVRQVWARASIFRDSSLDDWMIEAVTLDEPTALGALPAEHPLAAILWETLAYLGRSSPPARLRVESSIPIASGLGSGAAVSAVVVQALAGYFDCALEVEDVSMLVYGVEKIHHGMPSGIDNAVIAYAQPVFFIRGQPIEILSVGAPFHIAIADSGVSSPTHVAVAGVRERFEADPETYNAHFDRMGRIAANARDAITGGLPRQLGSLMNENHGLLQQIGVSTPQLDKLVTAAREAGAAGAKLSGAGLGGNIIALVDEGKAELVRAALLEAGARQVIITEVSGEQSTVNSQQ